jgi:2-hydroxy-6-oxonona-2,4-dienedioate hydrolase
VHRRVLEILMIADPARIDDLAIDIQAANVAKARFKSREFATTTEIRDRLADVRVPLRAIWGARDVLANPSVEAVFDILRLHHPELVTRVVPGAGHWSMYEQPDAFNAALLEVLAA